jgi:hypothetical protein
LLCSEATRARSSCLCTLVSSSTYSTTTCRWTGCHQDGIEGFQQRYGIDQHCTCLSSAHHHAWCSASS